MENELTRGRSEQIMIFEKFADAKLTLPEFRYIKLECDKKIEELQFNLETLQGKLQSIQKYTDDICNLGKYDLETIFTREMLLELVKEIKVYEDNRIEIVWNFL